MDPNLNKQCAVMWTNQVGAFGKINFRRLYIIIKILN